MIRPRLDAKRRGELAELAFLQKAAGLGLIVSKPYGDSARYDFLVDDGRRVWKVQVKSSDVLWQGAFYFNSHRSCNRRAVPYRQGEIDVIAGYVRQFEAWYIIPWAAFRAITSVRVYPHRKPNRNRYERFREGWSIFGAGEARSGRPMGNQRADRSPASKAES